MRTCIIAFVSLFILTGVAAPGATANNPSERWQSQLTQLVVAPESPSGYDRDEFGSGWTTQSDGCDTRDHVLRVEAKRGTKRGCDIKEGVWRSKYDGKTIRISRRLDTDHMVPLAEAWASGASQWSDTTRKDFANDLDFPDALIAVTASTNRSKRDRDPAEWMPPRASTHCWYSQAWVAVKYKYNLSVDPKEKKALTSILSKCKKKLVPAVTSQYPGVGTPQQPGTSTPPLPNNPGAPTGFIKYKNCAAARAAGVTPILREVTPGLYQANIHMDRDKDGDACEGTTQQPGTSTSPPPVTPVAPVAPVVPTSFIKYKNCAAARAAGVTPILREVTPGLYQANIHMDRDKDGDACE